MANTVFSHDDLVVKEAADGVLINNTFLPWDKAAALSDMVSKRHETYKKEKTGGREGMNPSHPDPVVLPPEGGSPSAGDPRAYPAPIRDYVEGDVTANHAEKRRQSKQHDVTERPAVDALAAGHGPKDEQAVSQGGALKAGDQHAQHRAKTEAARKVEPGEVIKK